VSFAASESAIVHGFQSFYYELLRQKERALSLYFTPPSQDPPDSDNCDSESELKMQNEVEGSIVTIQKKLITVISSASEMISVKSKLPPHFITDTKYIMTILADEVFINLRWDGAKYWRFSLLEKQLFQSEVAGDKFFKMLDEIIYTLDNDEMAFLYLMSLSLGFKGRYRDLDGSSDHIAWYKDRLYSVLHSKSSRLFYPGRHRMIESCYEYTDSENNNAVLPDSRFWSWCITTVIFIYIIISYCIWYSITDEIGDILEKIIDQTKHGSLI
jgi:type IV/VI secretion system ImpK/VasF family protein